MSEQLREKIADILRQNTRVRETVYGEREYYFFPKAVDQILAAIEEGIGRCPCCGGLGGLRFYTP